MNLKYAVLLFVLLLSCSEKKGELPVIDIRKDAITQANLSEIADTVIAIPLETRDDCLLVNGVVLLRDDSLLFIKSSSELFLFDTKGKFIKQLTRNGNGPGETKVYGFDLDRERKEVLVHGTGRRLFRYKYDGTFISSSASTLASYSFHPFTFYRDSIWAVGTSQSPDNSSWLLKMDTEFRIQDSIRLFIPDAPKAIFQFFAYTGFSVVDNQLYINHPSDRSDHIRRDTLYRVENGAIHPVLRLDFGDYPYVPNAHPHRTGYPISPQHIWLTKRFLITRYFHDKGLPGNYESYAFYYDFSSGKKYHLKTGFDDDLFHTGKVFPNPLDIYHSEFYYEKNADDLIGTAFERDESDNPVVFIMRLKE